MMNNLKKTFDWIMTFVVVIPVLGIIYIWEYLTE